MKKPLRSLPVFSQQVRDSLYCHLTAGFSSSRDVRVIRAGREKVTPTYCINRSSFLCYGLEFVAEGRGKLALNKKSQDIGPGNLFLYGPKCSQEIRTDPQRPLIKYFVNFYGDQSREWFKQSGIMPGSVCRVAEMESTRDLFENLIREGRKSSAHRNLICLDYLHLILLKARTSMTSNPNYSSRSFEAFEKSRRLIDNNYREIQSLQDLSRRMNMDPSHLCRLYKHFREDSPYSSLIRKKMDAAAELLVTKNILIKEAANAVGFEDALHFSRVFTKYFGKSPKAFVKEHLRRQLTIFLEK
ncbi:MAG: AraC family transcriptional regulator [Verrucomicrobiota bacterium]